MIKLTQELFKIDKVDSDGDIIPRKVAEEMIANRKAIPVTSQFGKKAKKLGTVTDMYIDGDRVMVTMEITGEDLWETDAKAGMGGFTEAREEGSEEKPYVFKTLTVTNIAMTHDKVTYPEEEE